MRYVCVCVFLAKDDMSWWFSFSISTYFHLPWKPWEVFHFSVPISLRDASPTPRAHPSCPEVVKTPVSHSTFQDPSQDFSLKKNEKKKKFSKNKKMHKRQTLQPFEINLVETKAILKPIFDLEKDTKALLLACGTCHKQIAGLDQQCSAALFETCSCMPVFGHRCQQTSVSQNWALTSRWFPTKK